MSIKIGDNLKIDGYSYFCYPHDRIVTDIKIEKYKGKDETVIICDNLKFLKRTGECIEGATAYRIVGST